MIAQVTGLKPGTYTHSIKDAHIYVNQVDGIKEQIRREDRYNKLSNMPIRNFVKLKSEVIEKMSKIEDQKSEEYKALDTELKIMDMIMDPVKPEMWLNPEVKDFFEFDNSKELKDVKVSNYKHMGKIEFPIAQ